MTRMLDSLAARPAPQRIVIALLLSIVGLFLAGLAVGVVAGAISHGHLPKRIWVLAIPFVAAPAAFLSLKTVWRLVLPAQSASAYEKRYWRMWMWVMALGVPVGIVYGISTLPGDGASFEPFSATPISALMAVLLAALVTVFASLGLYLYHRTIDDHEERAYLWGSQLAYYFLILAWPVWWLLERGGIVGPVTTAIAFGAVLLSFLVQGAVWAWLKFR